ncbi:MAG: F390 synthetase-related protein [Caldilineaceae bacterium]
MHQPFPASISAAAHQAATFATGYTAAHWRWRVLDPAGLQAFQNQRACQIVAYAAVHSPFYRRQWGDHDLHHWRTLPTVDKAAMMANFSGFNTHGITAETALSVALAAEQSRDFTPTVEGLTVGLSSGTSGHRGLFLVSPAEQAMWAGVILARALHTVRPVRTRVAFFLRSHSNIYQQADGALLRLRYFDLMAPLPESIAILNWYRPHILVGPPSLLGFLADAHSSGELHIRPQRLISVAEVLEPQDEARLVEAFDAPVHQVYQCTEGLLAVSCPQGSLHIQEDIVALQSEPLDGGRVTPIVTDLWRRTQPIIRYRLNDVLQLGGPCPCGSSFRTIARIEGRCDDVCYFLPHDSAAQGTRRPFFPDTIRRMILLAGGGIVDYQAVQERDGQLLVHLALAPGADLRQVVEAVRASVCATVDQYGCRPPEVDVDANLPPLPPGRKRRRVQRLQ